VMPAARERLPIDTDEQADEYAKEQAEEYAKEQADGAAKEAASEAYKQAYYEAYNEAYDERYKQAYKEALEQLRDLMTCETVFSANRQNTDLVQRHRKCPPLAQSGHL